MENLQGGWVILDKWADLSQFKTSGSLLYAKSKADAEKAYLSLLGASDKFKVYRLAHVPAHLHFNSNSRAGDPVVVPTGPYSIVAHDPNANGGARMPSRGGHGFDPRQMPSMKAIFYADGPDIRPGVAVKPFENVDVYPPDREDPGAADRKNRWQPAPVAGHPGEAFEKLMVCHHC